jgi:hypothetical protein
VTLARIRLTLREASVKSIREMSQIHNDRLGVPLVGVCIEALMSGGYGADGAGREVVAEV